MALIGRPMVRRPILIERDRVRGAIRQYCSLAPS
jgi:hypothetical protein